MDIISSVVFIGKLEMNQTVGYKRCYAKNLGNCDGKSVEHYISKSILESIGTFEVRGLPWIDPEESKVVSANALTAAVLCRHHNSLLSNYDIEATKLINHLKLIDGKQTSLELAKVPPSLVLDGSRIEKWFLKTLCAVMASGNYVIDGKGYGALPVSDYLVGLLFNDDPWKPGIGLYSAVTDKSRVDAFKGIGFDPVTARLGDEATIVGLDVHFWGFPLRGLFATHENNHLQDKYRPRGLAFMNGKVRRDVIFNWPTKSVTSNVPILTRTGTLPEKN